MLHGEITEFRTHTGEVVTGERLSNALNAVADERAASAQAIYTEDLYAPHVTQKIKERILQKSLEYAEQIRTGTAPMSFTLWQQINTVLTGECVGLLK